jgi:hypothetical protein
VDPVDERECNSVDILVDFRDPAHASVTLYAADLIPQPQPQPQGQTSAAATAGDSDGNGNGGSRGYGYRLKSYCTPLLVDLDLHAAGGGGYLAFLSHTKLSGFGHVKVEITPPNRVAQIDLSRIIEKRTTT